MLQNTSKKLKKYITRFPDTAQQRTMLPRGAFESMLLLQGMAMPPVAAPVAAFPASSSSPSPGSPVATSLPSSAASSEGLLDGGVDLMSSSAMSVGPNEGPPLRTAPGATPTDAEGALRPVAVIPELERRAGVCGSAPDATCDISPSVGGALASGIPERTRTPFYLSLIHI